MNTLTCLDGPHAGLRFNPLGDRVDATENVHGALYADSGRRDPETGDSIFTFVGRFEYPRPSTRKTQSLGAKRRMKLDLAV